MTFMGEYKSEILFLLFFALLMGVLIHIGRGGCDNLGYY